MSADIFGGTSTSWTCPYCTFINEDGTISCATCYQPRPGHKKQQQRKTENKDQQKIEKKETWGEWFSRKLPFKRSNSRSDKQKTEAWFCKKCTKCNSKEASKCASCGTHKTFKEDTLLVWTCSQCTYNNVNTAIECEGCGNCKKWDDVSELHDTPPTGLNGTPVDVIVINDEVNDDVVIIDPEGQPSHDHTKCSKCDLHTNSKCLCCDTLNMKLISSDKKESTFDPATQWECADCSFYNDNKQSRCAACDGTNNKAKITKQPPAPFNPSTHWQCPRCLLHNSNKDIQCSACRNRRKHPSVDEPASSFDPVKQWQCAHCSLHNDNKQTHCSACYCTKKTVDSTGKSPFNPSTHWKCSVCPVINSMADIQCIACGSKRKHPKMDATPFNPATQWQCASCSLYNDNKYSQCLACHGTKKTVPNDAKPSISTLNPATQWECIHCSLHNSSSRNWCEACHQLRPKITHVTPDKPVNPVIPYTREISIPSEPEESIGKRTRFYSNHTALFSLSVRNKRDLIDQDALCIYDEIMKFCKKVISL